MDAKAKYHLYETAHSGIIPGQTVNLVPKTWTTRTVTDGVWMTSATLSALDFRDYFLANMIDAVNEDKKNHYVGKDGIVIDHEKRTISYDPIDGKYVFDNNSAMWCEPNSKFVYTKLNENTNNKIKLKNGYINYDLTAANRDITATTTIIPTTITGLITAGSQSISEFPTGANVVFVNLNDYTLKKDLTTIDGGVWIDKDPGCAWNSATHQKDYWEASTGTPPEPIEHPDITYSSVFDPSDPTKYTGGLTGGKNYITDNVNMVPSEVLFIY